MHLDKVFLGETKFRGLTPDHVRHEVLRFLIWGLELTQVQRAMGWSSEEWKQISSKDLALFYNVFFVMPRIFAQACLSSWKQMNHRTLEQNFLYGELSKISPHAFFYYLRLHVVRKEISDWREWDMKK